MMKKCFKVGLIVLFFAGVANAGSLTSNFTKGSTDGKKPLSEQIKKKQKPLKITVPFTMPVPKEKAVSGKKRITASQANFAGLSELTKTHGKSFTKKQKEKRVSPEKRVKKRVSPVI